MKNAVYIVAGVALVVVLYEVLKPKPIASGTDYAGIFKGATGLASTIGGWFKSAPDTYGSTTNGVYSLNANTTTDTTDEGIQLDL